MRQTIDTAGILPTPAAMELLELLRETRPWRDENLVAARLRGWAARNWRKATLTPGVADGAAQVAEVLAALGREPEPAADEAALWIAVSALRRVALDREPWGSDPASDYVQCIYPTSTTRRWHALAREEAEAANRPDDGGLGRAARRIQREHDLAVLVRKGYTLPNARAWLQRNRGTAPSAAPPPRRRRIAADPGAGGEERPGG